MSGPDIPGYLERMRQVLAHPEMLGVNPIWLEQVTPRKELIFDQQVSNNQEAEDLLMDDTWLAGMLGGMYTAVVLLRDERFAHSYAPVEECECGKAHPLADVPRMVGNLLATMAAMLHQSDFRHGLGALVVTEGPAEPEAEE